MDNTNSDRPHQNLPELTLTCSNSDADSTASDLTGPGRAVDNFYCFAGRYLERFVNRIAAKMGKGPLPTVKRIRLLRAEIIAATIRHEWWCRCGECHFRGEFGPSRDRIIIRSPGALKRLDKKTRKGCRSLIHYIEKSEELSTQLQAVDSLLDLLIDPMIFDSGLRNMLDVCGAKISVSNLAKFYESYRILNCMAEQSLLAKSRHALVLLEETKLQAFLKDFINFCGPARDRSERGQQMWSEITEYLRTPKYAFLAMRAIGKLLDRTTYHIVIDNDCSDIARAIHCAVTTCPGYFEWSMCEKIICQTMCVGVYRPNVRAYEMMIDYIFRNIYLMPGICRRLTSRLMFTAESSRNRFAASNFTWDIITRSISQDSIQEISLASLESRYGYGGLRPVLKELVCPLRRTVMNFVAAQRIHFSTVPTPVEKHFYDEIVAFVDVSDTELRAKAWEYIRFFVKHDIYRCDAMLDALSRTRFSRSVGSSDHLESLKMTCVPEKEKSMSWNFVTLRSTDDPSDVKEMRIPWEWTIYAFLERGEAFSSEGLFPLPAGSDGTGKQTYLNEIELPHFSCKSRPQGSVYYGIVEGTKPEDLRVELCCPHRKALRIPTKFRFRSLRYAPEEYARFLGTDVESLYTSGPFSWKPVQDARHCQVQTRVMTVGEAFATGYSAEEIYPPGEMAYLKESNCDKSRNEDFDGLRLKEVQPSETDVDGILGPGESDSKLCSKDVEKHCCSSDRSSMAESGFQEDETTWNDEHVGQSSAANNVEGSIFSEDYSRDLDGLEYDLAGSSAISPDRTNDLLGFERVSEGDRPGDYSRASGQNRLLPDANDEELEPEEERSLSAEDHSSQGPDELLEKSLVAEQETFEGETQPCEEHASQTEAIIRIGSLVSRNDDPCILGSLSEDDGGKSSIDGDMSKGLVDIDPSSEADILANQLEACGDGASLRSTDEVKEGERRWQYIMAISKQLTYLIIVILAFILGKYVERSGSN